MYAHASHNSTVKVHPFGVRQQKMQSGLRPEHYIPMCFD